MPSSSLGWSLRQGLSLCASLSWFAATNTIMSTTHKRRASDRGLRRFVPDWLPERFYRDLWLLVISGCVLLAIANSQHAVDQIQKERAHNVLINCEASNQRYDNTIRALDDVIRNAPPGQKDRAEQNRASTVLLIQALAPPHEDRKGRSTCASVVKQQVSTTP